MIVNAFKLITCLIQKKKEYLLGLPLLVSLSSSMSDTLEKLSSFLGMFFYQLLSNY